VTLTDTGPLVALLDESDKFHDQVIRTAQFISWPPVTTEACIVDAAYLLGQALPKLQSREGLQCTGADIMQRSSFDDAAGIGHNSD
jgi:hypothetical protein